MSELHIMGQPEAVFIFPEIPSWNKVIDLARAFRGKASRGQQWSAAHGHTELWRNEGAVLARKFMDAFHPGKQLLIKTCALVVVKVFKQSEAVYDVHNICLKAIADGFTDAGIWPDDEWANVPLVLFAWGDNDDKGQRIEIEIHELAVYAIDGIRQTLPQGRAFTMKGKKRVGQVVRLPGEQLLFDKDTIWWDTMLENQFGPNSSAAMGQVYDDFLAKDETQKDIREVVQGVQLTIFQALWDDMCDDVVAKAFGGKG